MSVPLLPRPSVDQTSHFQCVPPPPTEPHTRRARPKGNAHRDSTSPNRPLYHDRATLSWPCTWLRNFQPSSALQRLHQTCKGEMGGRARGLWDVWGRWPRLGVVSRHPCRV